MKDADEELLYNTALEAQRMCKEYGATFIIDDHVGLAKRIHADGVHLGRNDMPIAEARALLGNDYIIGGTANTIEDVRNHWRDGADYIGCGPFRFTTTKARLAPILGLEGYERLVKVRDGLGRPLPLVAIGGITIADVPSLMSTGVDGVAISGCVVRAAEPVVAMRSLCRAMGEVG
jgi:thiamine-phosphate pyrophosphorylase